MTDFLNFSSSTPAAPAGNVNVHWQKDAEANLSAYVAPSGSFQTPWTQDIDGAGFKLDKVSALTLDTAAGPIRPLAWKTAGLDRWTLYMGEGDVLNLARYNDAGAYQDNAISIARLTGKVSIPADVATLGNIQSPTHASIGHSFNLYWDGSAFRYTQPGPGMLLNGGTDGYLRLWKAAPGAAGAMASLAEMMTVGSTITIFHAPPLAFLEQPSGPGVLFNTYSWDWVPLWQFGHGTDRNFRVARYPDGGSAYVDALGINRATGEVAVTALKLDTAAGPVRSLAWKTSGVDRWTWFMDAGEALSLARYNDAGVYQGNAISVARDTGLLSIASGLAANLPSVNPGSGSKQLWYDPADGNRIKFAA